MSQGSRKRKNEEEIEYVVQVPKEKYRLYDDAARTEDEQLTNILFGGASTFIESLDKAENDEVKLNHDSGIGEADSDDYEMDHKPAWTDDDDDGIEVGQALNVQGRKLPEGGINDKSKKYSDLLKHKFQSIIKTPKWATMGKTLDDSDDEILQTCGFLKNQQSSYLPGSLLEYKKMKDINCQTYCEGPYINSVEFFNNSSVALVAGQSGVASLLAVDGRKNTKLHSIGFQHYPIFCAKVNEENNEAIFGSRFPYIYCFDLNTAKSTKISLPPGLTTCKKFIISPDEKMIAIAGKWGNIHLLTSKSKEKIATLKQTHDVTSIHFSPRENLLYAHSNSGEITIFDINMRKVKHKFNDEGCLQGTTVCVSPSNQFIAAGSGEGVVNIYESNAIHQSANPKPVKTLMNLTTGITSLQFNPTSEILAYSSIDIMNSVKLFHVNSSANFKNFPPFGTKFGCINTISFSPGGGYVAFGNKKSVVSLYRLVHFKNY